MITIENPLTAKIIEQASLLFPDECCGFLFGREEINGVRTVTKVLEVNNAKTGDKRRRFEISPKDYMRAEKYATENELQLIGIYHSHPNHPAIPSDTDRLAALPWFSYLIISVINGKPDLIRSWRLNEISEFEEENVLSTHINQAI